MVVVREQRKDSSAPKILLLPIKVLFRVTERPFQVSERAFQVTERTFRDTEQKLLLGAKTFA